MTKILDIQQSITVANGNATLAKDLFTMLLDDLDSRSKQIEISFQAKDMENLEQHTHKLYGATAYCIAPELRKSTAKLEQALISNQYTELENLVENVLQQIQALMNDGPEYLKKEWLDIHL